ncbi:CBS domain-containing protein [Synechococcus sp. CBW1002]|uniref:CBS domain-containing protein n=1 Tax=Synechococcus sp. CBW1002 TaxID=1353134 RepID=UPI0018CF0EF2|nr:CBS domain-containing protein [Synechococcus sp. CBW1002]QPN61305.1 CBS domain-containing protein [Synechococcus sp. CBW1002]
MANDQELPPPVLPEHEGAILPVPPTLPTTASLEAALEAMRSSLREASNPSTEEEQLTGNCVLVLEGEQLVGILTERDAVRWALSDLPPPPDSVGGGDDPSGDQQAAA